MIHEIPKERIKTVAKLVDEFNHLSIEMLSRYDPVDSQALNEVGAGLMHALVYYIKVERGLRKSPESVEEIILSRSELFQFILTEQLSKGSKDI